MINIREELQWFSYPLSIQCNRNQCLRLADLTAPRHWSEGNGSRNHV